MFLADAARVRKHLAELEQEELRFIAQDYRNLSDRLQALERQLARQAVRGGFDRKVRELYWTATRLLGLGHLHDGSRERAAFQAAWIEQAKAFFGRLPSPLASSANAGRIFVDVTETTRCNIIAGASRTVTNIADQARRRGDVPVVMHDGAFWTMETGASQIRRIEPVEGDHLLLADVSWNALPDVVPIMERMSAAGVPVVFLLYDLLPVTHPPLFPPGFEETFRTWFDQIVARADAVIAISNYVAWDFVRHVRDRATPTKPDLMVGWAHLGSDLGLSAPGPSSSRVEAVCEGDAPFLLMVSTVEPRKGHTVALAAMDRLWATGSPARLVLVGRRGCQLRSIIEKILTHPEFGRRLIWFENTTDDELRRLYQRAHLSIYPSVAEGFGLPIVEAAAFGLEVVASDLPVFREIAGNNVTFFEIADPIALAERVGEALSRPKRTSPPVVMSWAQAAEVMMARIHNADYQLGRLQDAVAALS